METPKHQSDTRANVFLGDMVALVTQCERRVGVLLVVGRKDPLEKHRCVRRVSAH